MFRARAFVVVCCLLVITGVACLIAGIVLLNTAKPVCTDREGNSSKRIEKCDYSLEALRNDIPQFFQKVQDTYYDLHPEMILTKPKVTDKKIRERFMPYDPSPGKLKQITDKSLELLREIQGKKIVKHKLKPRERKGLAQMLHYLQHSFGKPYDGNYYAGDYVLGPNMFCWHTMCKVYRQVIRGLRHFKPSTIDDVQALLRKIKAVNHTFVQYKQNLMYGAMAGMVRSIDPCKVGVDSLIRALRGDVVKQGPQGIFTSGFGAFLRADFQSNLSANESQKWFTKTGKTITKSIHDHLLDYVGKPLYELTTYLKTTYLEHCVPSQVSSGLANLPIAHVYVNGNKTNQTTHPYLPDGTPLNGSKAYEHIMSFFTTTNITPDEVHALGYEMIDKLYSQVLDLARQFTNHTNNDTAKELFHQRLYNSSDMYYQTVPIPEIESNATAHSRCSTQQGAEKFCPVRWKIIQTWFENVNKIMSLLDGETVDMFYFTGSKHTTPNCPITPRANFDPNMGVPSYMQSIFRCPGPARYKVPFFLSRPGPKFTELSVNSHEARPGHHTQVQGHIEHFQDSCGGLIGWLDAITSYTAFVEGWGLYAENPLIAQDTNVYKDKPLDKYGMLRGQLWRALRLVVDTGLHFKGFSRQKALNYFKEYVWEESDVVEKEITRYQSNPGQATAYMIGQLHLIKLRARAQKELGKKFNLKDFHYHLLKDGSAPLSYLTESINEYIRCTNNSKGDGCEDVLAVKESRNTSSPNDAIEIDVELLPNHVIESYY